MYADDSGSVPEARSAAEALDAVERVEGILDETVHESQSDATLPETIGHDLVFDSLPLTLSVIATGPDVQLVKASQTTIVENVVQGAATIIQPLDEGARLMTVIDDSCAEAEYAYHLDMEAGASLDMQADGSIAILNEDGDGVGIDVLQIFGKYFATMC